MRLLLVIFVTNLDDDVILVVLNVKYFHFPIFSMLLQKARFGSSLKVT